MQDQVVEMYNIQNDLSYYYLSKTRLDKLLHLIYLETCGTCNPSVVAIKLVPILAFTRDAKRS